MANCITSGGNLPCCFSGHVPDSSPGLCVDAAPPVSQVMVFTYLRLAKLFSDYQSRLCCVQARLQAISILIYSHTVQVGGLAAVADS